MQLRYMQTLGTIAGDKSSTIVFPLPVDLLKGLVDRQKELGALCAPFATQGRSYRR
jgi:hypothetical protein